MPQPSAPEVIRLRGVRHNNLKGFDLDLPLRRLIVITGLSGSGKSSLAFDTLFAEGQRRYIETFSPYARQFFDRMDKPKVDSIEGIPPAIALEQRNSVRTMRSTVGTMTEICDYLKTLWPHLAQLHCRGCGKPVRKDTPAAVWETVRSRTAAAGPDTPAALITFEVPLAEKLPLAESLALVAKQGFQRLWLEGEAIRLEEAQARLTARAPRSLTVVQDRVKLAPANRARFVEACEQAYHFGKGKLEVRLQDMDAAALPFSARLHCAACDLEYRDPSPPLFSFNHPLGACPHCRGFGRIITIDYQRAIPDRSLSLAGGAIRPWRTGTGAESQQDLLKFCKQRGVPTDVPFASLPPETQTWVIEGDPGYGQDEEHQWPRSWYGVKGYFRWLESKAYKMHVRVLLSRYRAYSTCPKCAGRRFNEEALLYRLRQPEDRTRRAQPAAGTADESGLNLAEFYDLPLTGALAVVEGWITGRSFGPGDPLALALREVRSRLAYLVEVGLGYLTLSRPTRTLSGGETERVNLTTCVGTGLVNTLFVLDEPSVGLHARDTQRLVRILERLRDAGNTVVVVEHEASVMRAADQIVDLGPGHGEGGGRVIFQGAYRDILKAPQSLTGGYLSGRKRIETRTRRVQTDGPALHLSGVTLHNLRDLAVAIPLNRFVVVSGVSGSGKTTLIREVLFPLLEAKLQSAARPVRAAAGSEVDALNPQADDEEVAAHAVLATAQVTGWESLAQVLLVDQSPIGKTPRSNPAVYVGAFDDIREVFAQSPAARQRGLNASAFSFNSAQGRCERCRGAGFEKIEMQFLSDVFIRCPDCDGRRYRRHILEVKIEPPRPDQPNRGPARTASDRRRANRPEGAAAAGMTEASIGDLLEATVEDAIHFLSGFDDCKPARRAADKLGWLQEVGLGYLRLGQPINTLSGGESQRLKLVSHLAAAGAGGAADAARGAAARPTLFLFDEPTTGLHFDDVRVLLQVFQRLVEAGHSVLAIEHQLDVIRSADWVIDLGPEAGAEGGRIVAAGPPEVITACAASHTGRALRTDLTRGAGSGRARSRPAVRRS
jgi:excinuclease ABC subunit A